MHDTSRKVLFSLSYDPTIKIEAGTCGNYRVEIHHRGSDWGLTGIRKRVHHVTESWRLMRLARNYHGLVICTVGIEAFVLGKFKRWICPKTHVICADILMPRDENLPRVMRGWLKGLDGFACIRTGDMPVLQRKYGVRPDQCFFVPFPADQSNLTRTAEVGDYIYAAGTAHRDWRTLLQALQVTPYKAVLCTNVALDVPEEHKDRIRVIPLLSPKEGKEMTLGAQLVIMPMLDTELPSGPLVLLDAMSMGKAVIATHVNGTRDYVRDGITGVMVPPQDSDFLARSIDQLMKNGALRESMGANAREDVKQRFTPRIFLAEILSRVPQ